MHFEIYSVYFSFLHNTLENQCLEMCSAWLAEKRLDWMLFDSTQSSSFFIIPQIKKQEVF